MSAIPETTHPLQLDPSHLPPLVKTLRDHFASGHATAYLVGGVVRDVLLGRDTFDVDLAVERSAHEAGMALAERLGGRVVTLDDSRDIVRVVLGSDHAATNIDISSYRDSIEEDLSRRDFTIDAMAVPVSQTQFGAAQIAPIDPHEGARDLREGRIRALRPSVFKDDPARLMRAPRLAVQLGFRIDEDTAESIRQHAYLVSGVAAERVRDELLKLLAEPGAAASLRLLDELGLLTQVIPELGDAQGVTQPKEHHWDVFNHSVETAGRVDWLMGGSPEANAFVAEAVPWSPSVADHFSELVSDGHSRLTLLRLAGLLHDVAKPETRTVEPTGRIRFLGHHREGARKAEHILGRLRFSRRGVELVSAMVEHHLRPSQMSQGGELPTPRAVYRYYRDVADAAIDTLYLNLADYLAARGPSLSRQEWSDHCRIIDRILEEGPANTSEERPPRLVDGHEIMHTFSLQAGPQIGSLLELVRESHAGGEIETKEEALELVRSRLHAGEARA